MIDFAMGIKRAVTDDMALVVYSRYVNACDVLYVKTMQSTGASQSRLKRNTEAYKGLMLQMQPITKELTRRGILRKALEKHPMKY